MRTLRTLLLFLFCATAPDLVAQIATPPAGDGTDTNPYVIADLENLYWVTQNSSSWDKYFVQTADIDASSSSSWDSNQGWSPIGQYGVGTTFSGHYDGGGHVIDGLYMNRPSRSHAGVFGRASAAVISDLGVTNVNFTCSDYLGALAGWIDYGTAINRCFATGVLSAGDTGGLVDVVLNSTISDSYARVNMVGIPYAAGGFVEGIQGSTISNCFSTGTVSSVYDPGGLVSSSTTSSASGCFWDTQTSGRATSALGTGATTAVMKTASTFTGAGWNSSVWHMDAGINDGYPYLAWQNPGGTLLPVELSSLTAVETAEGIRLRWTTSTEVDNFGFEVERNVVGDWEKLGFIDGHGTTSSPHEYSYLDTKVTGDVSYRLKQIDRSGAFTYSAVVTLNVKRPNGIALLQNHPNPFNPSTTIRFDIPTAISVKLEVFDVVGRHVATMVDEEMSAGRHTAVFDGLNLPSGVYVTRLSAGGSVQFMRMQLLK